MQQRKQVDSYATSGLTNVPLGPTPIPARTQSPDALALAAEWWRVEEMNKAGCRVLITVGNIDIVSWMNSYGRLGQAIGPTPAAAIIAAHEAWQKEHGK